MSGQGINIGGGSGSVGLEGGTVRYVCNVQLIDKVKGRTLSY